jgi:MFS family permease
VPSIDPPSAAPAPAAPAPPLANPSTHDLPQADPRRFKALAVIAIAQLMIVLDASIVNLAIPSASADLQIAPADVQWIITAYTLTFGGFLLLGGRIADYWGRKRTFQVGLLGFAIASLIGGLAPSLGLLIAARALQGGFAALLAPAALALISVSFHDPKERAKAFGVIGAISGGGAALGLLLGGVLTEYFSWRWCLAVNTPSRVGTTLLALAGLAVCGLAFATDPTQRVTPATWHGRLHDLSFVLLGLTLVPSMLALGAAFRRDQPWRDLATYTFVSVALVLPAFWLKGAAFYAFLVVILSWSEVVAIRLFRITGQVRG